MKIPKKFSLGVDIEQVPDLKKLLNIKEKDSFEYWRGEFKEKEKTVSLYLSFSEGEREPRGAEFKPKGWFKGSWSNRNRVYLILEKV